LIELRERAKRLGISIHTRGTGYEIIHPDGTVTGAAGLVGLSFQLDVAEKKVAEWGQSGATDAGASAEQRKQEYAAADDAALAEFDAHVRGLVQVIKGQTPQRFAKTAVAQPLLGDLAHFLREVVAVRKLVVESGDHNIPADLSIPDCLRRK
jgi:hypothetical protein